MFQWGGKSDLLLNISAIVLAVKQVCDLPSLGRNRLRADLRRRALGDTIESARELVAGVLADLLRDVWVVVVERLCGSEGFDEREVARAAGCDDLTARQNRELDRQAAGRSATAVDEQRLVRLLAARQWESQALV